MESTGYAYATGRVRAMERLLISKSGFDRMIDAKTYEDTLKVLTEAGYGTDARPEGSFTGAAASGLAQAGVPDPEMILDHERVKLGILIREITPESCLYNFFMIRNDYHNLKVLLKAEFSGQEAGATAAVLSWPAIIEPDKLKILVRDRLYAEMHPIMREAVKETLDLFGRTGDPQLSDIILDTARFAQMREYAGEVPGDFTAGLLEIMTDSANIKALLRCRKLKKQADFIRRVIMQGGSIGRDYYSAMLGDSMQEMAEKLQATKYGVFIREGMAVFNATGRMAGIEKAMDRCVTGYVSGGKYVAVGPEPVIRYIVLKEFEIMNAGIILAGKINKITNDVIRERIREY